jgi:transcription elongation GreA/GreB family factor
MDVQPVERVDVGTWCKVTGLAPNVETVLHFVPLSEVNYQKHLVSREGSFGVLIGAKAGDKVVADIAGRRVELTVLEVGHN